MVELSIGVVGSGIDASRSVENEWLCLAIAGVFGLEIVSAEILDFAGVRALVVRRFDREGSRDRSWLIRILQEDFCRALGLPPARRH